MTAILRAYAVACLAALACVVLLEQLEWGSLLSRVAVADLLATLVVFGFSVRHDNSSVYDAYWSVFPIWLVGYLAWAGVGSGAVLLRVVLVAALVCAWGVRLTHNWARGWSGLSHEDWRYVAFRERCGRWYWPVSLLGIHLFPTVLVYLGCLPIIAVFTWPGRPLGWLDGLATIVTIAAITLELVADNQLRAYVQQVRATGSRATLCTGVWAWSRHPNYLGEIGFWWGMLLFGVAAVGPRPWWLWCGALAMMGLFSLVSIPLIEARMATRRSDWDEVRRRVPRLLPVIGLRR